MKIKITLLLCLFNTIISFSQNFSSHSVALTPTAFPVTNFDAEVYKERLRKRLITEKQSSDLERYITQSALGTAAFFSSSYIYTNWPEATEYVKKVFTTAIPKEFNTGDVKIYVVRDPSPNAFCMEDGNIAVTVGLLSFMTNEAELAEVLSHEFGHYYSNHNYLDFKKQNKNKIFKGLSSTSAMGSLMIAKNLSSFQQDQERQADTFAYNFFTKNGYSPEAVIQANIDFQKITTKYKKLKGFRIPLFYFSTHPSDEERLQNAKNAFKNKSMAGKNFQVDSIGFSTLKKRAIDETIYLLFEGLQYDECLEMAYLQYLYNPNDEFYIFFITECLRRQMIFESYFEDELFISGKYSGLTQPTKNLAKNNFFLKGKEVQKINAKEYSRSIYANLQSEIYNLTDNDIKTIQAKEVFKTDTLEYIYNKDALAYFTKKIPPYSCIFNIHRVLESEPVIGDCENKPGSTELENDYTKVIADYKTLRRNVNSYKKVPVIFFDLNTYVQSNRSIISFYDATLSDALCDDYRRVAAGYSDEILDTKNKFNFRELQKIKSTTQFIESIFGLSINFSTIFNGGRSGEKDYDFLNIFPELSSEINKYNYRKLIFLEINVTNPAYPGKKTMFSGMETWGANIYTVDLVNKKILKTQKRFNWLSSGGNRDEKITKILDACQNDAQE